MRLDGRLMRSAAAAAAGAMLSLPTVGESLPGSLHGSWRIMRVLPTTNKQCWGRKEALPLLGSTLTYKDDAMRWRGGEVRLQGVSTRELTDMQFRKENGGDVTPAAFSQLGIRASRVLEVNLQHDDADVTGATTEVPGDSVLLAGPNRIVVSACGVYFEATRTGLVKTAEHRWP